MTNYEAIGIAEGFIDCEQEEKIVEAWQHLIDTGLCWTLQGWFGRRAIELIEEGICIVKDSNHDNTRTLEDEEAMWRMWGDQ